MIIAMGVMFVTSLLLVAAFTAANGDIHLSNDDTIQKEAYYAALAGIQEYQFRLEKEPDYWQTCVAPTSIVPEAESERYEIKLLPANGEKACSTAAPFATMIESKGQAANTFRIESIGCAGKTELTSCSGQPKSSVAVRKIVASFKATGFLQFVYFTRYEDEDPALYSPKANCETYFEVKGVKRASECQLIEFITGDSVKGPMHTDDTAVLCGSPEFGRPGRATPDKVEINGGLDETCSSKPVFNTATKSFIKGHNELVPPTSDESLASYVEPAYKFSGVTQLTLNGTTSKITVINNGETKEVNWPENGLIYVEKAAACGYTFTGAGADGPKEKGQEANCGNVYVRGSYSKSLTIAGQNDLIISGSLYPTSVASSLGSEPSGTATLGLIASEFVRVYHAVQETYKPSFGNNCNNGDPFNNGTKLCEDQNTLKSCDAPNLNASEDEKAGGYGYGSQENIWIYAAILSTKHSFTVDNYHCGNKLEKLNVYGAIAQNFRGIVKNGEHGYDKNYNYDERLAADEPPYFLQPLNTGWEVNRETAPEGG